MESKDCDDLKKIPTSKNKEVGIKQSNIYENLFPIRV